MTVNIRELTNLSSDIYLEKIQDISSLHKIIAKCKEMLISQKLIDDLGNFIRSFNFEQEIELKKIIELFGYCHYLLKDYTNAFKVYQELIISDCSPFNSWEAEIIPREVENFYLGLRDNHAKIIQILESFQKDKGKKSELYRELYSLYFALGYYSLATDNLEKYLEEEPSDFEHWYLLAEYYEYKKNYQKTIECMENAYNYGLMKGYLDETEGYKEKLIELRNIK